MPAPGTPDDGGLDIRSFHVVFALERRLHRIDRWRLPFPYGVPVRAIAYGAGAMLAILVVGQLPLIGTSLRAIPAPLRLVIGPALIGAGLARLRIDGRPAHRHLIARLAHQLTPSRRSGSRTIAPVGTQLRLVVPIVIAPDENIDRYRAASIDGPADVLLHYPATGSQRGNTLRLVQDGERPLPRPKLVALAAGQRLVLSDPPRDAA